MMDSFKRMTGLQVVLVSVSTSVTNLGVRFKGPYVDMRLTTLAHSVSVVPVAEQFLI